MKDTPQLQNAEDLMVLYEELTFLVSQLNSDAPKIKKMYTSLEQTIAKQEAAAVKAGQTIETATSATIAKLQKESKDVLDAAAQHLAKAEAVAKRCEAVLSQVEAIAKNMQSVREYQLAVDKRLTQIEEKVKAASTPQISIHSKETETEQNKLSASHTVKAPSTENEFPRDSMRFTFKDIKSVSHTKPYGIVIDGETIIAEHWTNLLESVLLYAFESFGVKKDHLCTADLGMHFPKTAYSEAHMVPYFAKRAPSNTNYKYRRMSELGISVLSEGADITVEVIDALLCDYLKINPGNVELFYHKK